VAQDRRSLHPAHRRRCVGLSLADLAVRTGFIVL
jgi:hypothetical protein